MINKEKKKNNNHKDLLLHSISKKFSNIFLCLVFFPLILITCKGKTRVMNITIPRRRTRQDMGTQYLFRVSKVSVNVIKSRRVSVTYIKLAKTKMKISEFY